MRAEPQPAPGCRSGRRCGLCCLREGCERSERGGGEEEFWGSTGGQAGYQPAGISKKMSDVNVKLRYRRAG